MVTLTKEIMYVSSIPSNGLYFLAGDIGGTNSNFGIFHLSEKKPELVVSVHYKSQEITDFAELVKYICGYIYERYNIFLKKACFAAAGIVKHNRKYAKPTNLNFIIDLQKIKNATRLKELFLINDFEAVALGLDLINPKDVITIHEGSEIVHGNKAFIGAGTGLGKSILIWDYADKRYIPISSEGGHADFVAYNIDDLELLNFIKSKQSNICSVSWEDILSGRGIQRIYSFLNNKKQYPVTDITKEIAASDFNPDKISRYSKVDMCCKDTFSLYVRLYARCVKNFVLESLALGGIYIAGGIAAKNVSLFFDPIFMQEFNICGKHTSSLLDVPIYIIADYNISLYGAVVAAAYHRLEII